MLWMTKTPLRVSLFGGGTDYPEYFHRYPGAVVGLSIDKYIYITALKLTAFQAYNYRVSYSRLEHCGVLEEIEHPVVREVLRHFEVTDRLDISVVSDLPSTGSGLGSSSAFTVGFLRAVYALRGVRPTKIDLAKKAIAIERDILQENVGVQDQLHAAFGGINRFDFDRSAIRISPVQAPSQTMELLNATMVLVHTGIARRATRAVAAQVQATAERRIDRELGELYRLVGLCVDLLETGGTDWIRDLGAMLSESWLIKRTLSDHVTSAHLDHVYSAIMASGAYGAKLCGAGGGGFFLALIDPDRVATLSSRLPGCAVVRIRTDVDGSMIAHQSLT